MQRSYVSVFWRHPFLVCLPVVLAFLVGAGLGVTAQRHYVAAASVWADSPVPDPSTVGTTGGTAPPANGQQALLTQLLASHGFLVDVATSGRLPGFADLRDPVEVNAALAQLAASVTMAVPGPNVLSLGVQQDDPASATRVAAALVDRFLSVQRAALRLRGQSQLNFAKAQVASRSTALSTARATLSRYLADNPGSQAVGDSQGDGLRTAVIQAQDQYARAVSAVSDATAQASLAGDQSVLYVLDAPTQATPTSRRKPALLGGIGGLLAGSAVAMGLLLLLMGRDRALHDEREVEQVLGLPVAAVVSELPRQRRQRDAAREPRQGRGA